MNTFKDFKNKVVGFLTRKSSQSGDSKKKNYNEELENFIKRNEYPRLSRSRTRAMDNGQLALERTRRSDSVSISPGPIRDDVPFSLPEVRHIDRIRTYRDEVDRQYMELRDRVIAQEHSVQVHRAIKRKHGGGAATGQDDDGQYM